MEAQKNTRQIDKRDKVLNNIKERTQITDNIKSSPIIC